MNDPAREQREAAARARMAELGVRFLERTAGDLELLRQGLARGSRGDAQALGEICQLAHRLAGTGATLGFLTLAERARDLELAAERAGAPLDEARRQELHAALRALEEEFARQSN